MKNRIHAARIISTIPLADRPLIFSMMREEGLWADNSLDRSFRGCGNAAARRQGIDTRSTGCDCVVCVVYGGDCSYQMWKENHSEWHRARRGVKTRGL